MKRLNIIVLSILAVWSLTGCGHNDQYTPKPKSYLRFDFPEKEYTAFDTTAMPFSFERAKNSEVVIKKNERRLKWVDIKYPEQNGVVFLSYINMKGPQDLKGQIDTSYELLKQHFDFSSGIDEKEYHDPENHVFAVTYHLQGSSVASTYQFWATDSTNHFLRGSLYLDCTPNNDSLAPVLDYLQKDLVHLLETLKWRE